MILTQKGVVVAEHLDALVEVLVVVRELRVRLNQHLKLARDVAVQFLQVGGQTLDVAVYSGHLCGEHRVDPVDPLDVGLHLLSEQVEALLHLTQLPDVDLPQLLLGLAQILQDLVAVTTELADGGLELVHNPRLDSLDVFPKLVVGFLELLVLPLLRGSEHLLDLRHTVVLGGVLNLQVPDPDELQVLLDLDDALTVARCVQGALQVLRVLDLAEAVGQVVGPWWQVEKLVRLNRTVV
mmetsp:Transcript_39805/g.89821  ORF Transcript_39805/g.89821 Transcript_39805/m.89821 type:complete len:238 (-) Transcript_39805:132-845(-)